MNVASTCFSKVNPFRILTPSRPPPQPGWALVCSFSSPSLTCAQSSNWDVSCLQSQILSSFSFQCQDLLLHFKNLHSFNFKDLNSEHPLDHFAFFLGNIPLLQLYGPTPHPSPSLSSDASLFLDERECCISWSTDHTHLCLSLLMGSGS